MFCLRFFRLRHPPSRGAIYLFKGARAIRIVKNINDLPTRYNASRDTELVPTARTAVVKRAPLPPLTRTGKPRSFDQAPGSGNPEPLWRVQGHTSPDPDNIKTELGKQVARNLRLFPHAILLTHVGDFWESYFDQAIEVSRLLKLVLTKKDFGDSIYPFAGFPLPFLPEAIRRLVREEHRTVALCEEFKVFQPNGIDFQITRRVVRVITPGTLLDEPFIDTKENNYLLAVSLDTHNKSLGLSWMDVTNGDFFTESIDYNLDKLADHCFRISPREVLLDANIRDDLNHPLRQFFTKKGYFVAPTQPAPTPEASQSSSFQMDEQSRASLFTTSAEYSAVCLLSDHISSTLLDSKPLLSNPSHRPQSSMHLSSTSLAGLDILVNSYEGGIKGSLLNIIDRTFTKGGHRLLFNRLASPSTSIEEILYRLSLITHLRNNNFLSEDIRSILKSHNDPLRSLQRLNVARGDPSDYIILQESIDSELVRIRNVLASHCKESKKATSKSFKDREENEQSIYSDEEDTSEAFNQLVNEIKDHQDVSKEIKNALVFISAKKTNAVSSKTIKKRSKVSDGDDEAEADIDENEDESESDSSIPASLSRDFRVASNAANKIIDWDLMLSEKWTVNPKYTPSLTKAHKQLKKVRKEAASLQEKAQKLFKSKSITLKSHQDYGPVISSTDELLVTQAKSKKQKSSKIVTEQDASTKIHRLGKSNNDSLYYFGEWDELCVRIGECLKFARQAEKDAFNMLRDKVMDNYYQLRNTYMALYELDLSLGFATLSIEQDHTRPTLDKGTDLHIVNGRHPAVEHGLLLNGLPYVPNSIHLSSDGAFVNLITGPNMGGKSTHIRMAALIVLLAQVGAYVPAARVKLGIVDRIFTRMSSVDNVYEDESSYMVEMKEASEIVRLATDRSLAIIDEVGRGTAIPDGVALSYATIDYLVRKTKTRALIATHFHELAPMFGQPSSDSVSAPEYKPDSYHRGLSFYQSKLNEHFDDSDNQNSQMSSSPRSPASSFEYTYSFEPGFNLESHGIRSAELACMPEESLNVARNVFNLIVSRRKLARSLTDKTRVLDSPFARSSFSLP